MHTTKSRTGSPHQWLTNQSGGCAARATISTKAHCRATVNGRMMYLSASYSATVSGASGSPFHVAQPSALQRRSMCAGIARSCTSLMARSSVLGIAQPLVRMRRCASLMASFSFFGTSPASSTSSRKSAFFAISSAALFAFSASVSALSSVSFTSVTITPVTLVGPFGSGFSFFDGQQPPPRRCIRMEGSFTRCLEGGLASQSDRHA